MIKSILKNIEQCDDFHNRCDYLLEHDESTRLIEYITELEKENKEFHNKIDKVIKILKEHFVEEYIRSCDTSDGVGRYEIDTEHWTYKAYEILKDSDVDD